MIDLVGADRILFSSDGPYMELVVSNARWVKIIKDLPQNAPRGIQFTGEEISAILGGNAQKILGI
jgi:predicted TIM-barrel fold metal-dependent hydrolase